MIDLPLGPPFVALTLSGVRQSPDDVGPGDPDHFMVVRYLDSAPVVLTLGTPEVVPGTGVRHEYRCDGVALWDDLEHDEATRRPVYFTRGLVERARRSDGVCPPIPTTVVADAVDQVMNDRRAREAEALELE